MVKQSLPPIYIYLHVFGAGEYAAEKTHIEQQLEGTVLVHGGPPGVRGQEGSMHLQNSPKTFTAEMLQYAPAKLEPLSIYYIDIRTHNV